MTASRSSRPGELEEEVEPGDIADWGETRIKEEERAAEDRKTQLETGLRLLLGAKLDATPASPASSSSPSPSTAPSTRVMDALIAAHGRDYDQLYPR